MVDQLVAYEVPIVSERETLMVGETSTHFIDVTPMAFGIGLISTAEKPYGWIWTRGWYYERVDLAIVAAHRWVADQLKGEPEGWYRARELGKPDRDV